MCIKQNDKKHFHLSRYPIGILRISLQIVRKFVVTERNAFMF